MMPKLPLLAVALAALVLALVQPVAAAPSWEYYYTLAGEDKNAMVSWQDTSITVNNVTAFIFLGETGGDLVIQAFDQDGNYLGNYTYDAPYQDATLSSYLRRFAYTTYRYNDSLAYIVTVSLTAQTADSHHGIDYFYTVGLFSFDGSSLNYIGGQNYSWTNLCYFHEWSHDEAMTTGGLFVQGVADVDGNLYVAPMGWAQGSWIVYYPSYYGVVHYSLMGVNVNDVISIKTSYFNTVYETQPPYGYSLHTYSFYGLPMVYYGGAGIVSVITPGFYYRYNTNTLQGSMIKESAWSVYPDWISRDSGLRWITAPYPAGSTLSYIYYSSQTGYILGYEMFSVFADNNQTWVYGSEYMNTGNVLKQYQVQTLPKYTGASFLYSANTHQAVMISTNSSVSPEVWRKVLIKYSDGSDMTLANFAIGYVEASLQTAPQKWWTSSFGAYAANYGYGAGVFTTKVGDYQRAVIQKLTYKVDTQANLTLMYLTGFSAHISTTSTEYAFGFDCSLYASPELIPGWSESISLTMRTGIQVMLLFLPPLLVRRYGMFFSAVVLMIVGAVLWMTNVIPAYLFGMAAVASVIMMLAARRQGGDE